MRRAALWAWLCGVVLSGCDEASADTCAAANDELSVVAIAVDNGSRIRAEIDFHKGDRTGTPSPLAVCGDEVLTIAGQEPTTTEKADRIVYSATLPTNDSREVEFRLERADTDAVVVTVPVPPAFDIVAPIDDDDVSRSQELILQWDPPLEGSELRVSVEEEIGYGLCVITEAGEHHYKTRAGVTVPDTGTWTIPAGVISSGNAEGTCDAFYTLRRVLRSNYPDSLSPGGFIEGRVLRSVQINSVP